MIQITDEMVGAYKDSIDPNWRDTVDNVSPEFMSKFNDAIRKKIAAVAPIIAASERAACLELVGVVVDYVKGLEPEHRDRAREVMKRLGADEVGIRLAETATKYAFEVSVAAVEGLRDLIQTRGPTA